MYRKVTQSFSQKTTKNFIVLSICEIHYCSLGNKSPKVNLRHLTEIQL
jgi:hypothetical protein